MSYGLGVDLGTTYSAAARYRDGTAEMISLGNRSTAVPSAVLVTREGEFLVGEAALRRGATEPERLAREFKRRIGDSVPVILGGTPLSAETLSARLLRWIVDHASGQEGGPPDRVALTYPANWGLYKQELLAQVIRLAEVGSAITLTEPDAAAISYAATERVAVGEVVAVYDLGGGTFDAAILRKTASGFDLLGDPEGIERRGGIDFDEAVFAHVNQALDGELDRLPSDDPVIVQAVARLRQDCIEAKEALSADTDVTIPVVLPHRSSEVRLTRAELESMVRPVLNDTIDALRRAISSADLTTEQINRVLLVGGSSRMPLVGQLLAETLGRPYFVDAHPKYAVALGAARMVGEAWTTAIVPAVRIDAPGAAAVAGAGAAATTPPPPPTRASPPPPEPVPPPGPPPPTGLPPSPGPLLPHPAAPAPWPETGTEPDTAASSPPPTTREEVQTFESALPLEQSELTRELGPVPPPLGPPDEIRPDGASRPRLLQRGLAVLAVAAVLVFAVVQLTDDGGDDDGGDGGGEPPEAPTLEVVATIPVGSFPEGLAIDGDNLYSGATFGARDTENIYRIDLGAREVADTFSVGGEPLGMLVAQDSLWVARRGPAQVSQIDLASGVEIATVDTPGTPQDLAFGAGALWVAAAEGTLYRVDPTSYEVQVVSDQLGDNLAGIVATDDVVYAAYSQAGGQGGTVTAFDPTSLEAVDRVSVEGALDEMALGNALWVAQRDRDTVTKIDPSTFEVVAEVQVEQGPAGIAIDGEVVWVINNDADSLTYVDGPSATALTTIPVGAAPLGVIASNGGVWVSLSGADTVVRVEAI